jgi:hypothetical protein
MCVCDCDVVGSHVEKLLPAKFVAADLEKLLQHPSDYRCLMSRALTGHVIIPDFGTFCDTLEVLVAESAKLSEGEGEAGDNKADVARSAKSTQEIKSDSRYDSEDEDEDGIDGLRNRPLAAVCVHTIDGQRFSSASFSSAEQKRRAAMSSIGSTAAASRGKKGGGIRGGGLLGSGIRGSVRGNVQGEDQRGGDEDGGDTELLIGDLCRPLLYALACEMTLVTPRAGRHSRSKLPRSSSLTDTTYPSLVGFTSVQHERRRSATAAKVQENDENDSDAHTGGRYKYAIHEFVGTEASGEMDQFDFLNEDMKPYNSLTHAGSLLTTGCIVAVEKARRRRDGGGEADSADVGKADDVAWLPLYEKFVLLWHEITGKGHGTGKQPEKKKRGMGAAATAAAQGACCQKALAKLKANADVTNGLWYIMQAKGSLPEGVDREEVLETFHKLHCLTVTMREVAAFAGTLATGGISPVTNERVLHADTVKDLNAMMFACGMGKESGEFSFHVGVPSLGTRSEFRASVVMLVVPDVMGVCYYDRFLERKAARHRRAQVRNAELKKKNAVQAGMQRNTAEPPTRGSTLPNIPVDAMVSLGVLGTSIQGQFFCRQFVETFRFHLFSGNDDIVADAFLDLVGADIEPAAAADTIAQIAEPPSPKWNRVGTGASPGAKNRAMTPPLSQLPLKDRPGNAVANAMQLRMQSTINLLKGEEEAAATDMMLNKAGSWRQKKSKIKNSPLMKARDLRKAPVVGGVIAAENEASDAGDGSWHGNTSPQLGLRRPLLAVNTTKALLAMGNEKPCAEPKSPIFAEPTSPKKSVVLGDRTHSSAVRKSLQLPGRKDSIIAVAGVGDYEELLAIHFSYDPCAFWQGGEQMCSMVLEAAQSGDLGLLRQLHANGVSVVSIADYDLRTAGHLACVEGNIEIVKYLKRHSVSFDLTDRWGRTAIDDARSSGHVDIVAFLLGRAGAPKTPNWASGSGGKRAVSKQLELGGFVPSTSYKPRADSSDGGGGGGGGGGSSSSSSITE